MDATRGTGTAYPSGASDFNHVKIVWVLDNMAFLSFDCKLKDRQYNGQLKKYTLPFLEQHLSGTLKVKR
jgi:hypothetical protein